MNTERYQVSESILSLDSIQQKEKEKENQKKRSSSFFSKFSFLASLSPDHWIEE
jgi:hypothetical protein